MLAVTASAVSALIVRHAPPGALVPLHFDAGGHPGYFVSPLRALVGFAALQLAVWGAMAVLPRLAKPREGFDASIGFYNAIWITASATLGMLQIAAAAYAVGTRYAVNSLSCVMIGALFVVMGNGLGKIRPNNLVGIRTLYTKRSPRVWERTHRAAGPFFVIVGVILVAAGFGIFGAQSGTMFEIGSALAIVIVSYVLSWIYWRIENNNPSEPTHPT